METRSVVFYVRVRPETKRKLVDQMMADGFNNMTDWFEQFVAKKVKKQVKRGKKRKKRASKKR